MGRGRWSQEEAHSTGVIMRIVAVLLAVLLAQGKCTTSRGASCGAHIMRVLSKRCDCGLLSCPCTSIQVYLKVVRLKVMVVTVSHIWIL